MGFGNFIGNITGGLIGESDAEKAAKDASKLSTKTKNQVLEELRGALGLAEQDIQPLIDAGLLGLDELTQLAEEGAAPTAPTLNQFTGEVPIAPELEQFNFDPNQLGQTDAFKFRFDTGQQATDRALAGNRGLGSGNRLLALQNFGQGLASTELENEFARQAAGNQLRNQAALNQFGAQGQQFNMGQGQTGFNNQVAGQQFGLDAAELGTIENRLNNLVNLGQGASTNLANFRLGTAGNVSNALTQNAANQFSSSLIPVQEKQNFTNSLFELGGIFAGG